MDVLKAQLQSLLSENIEWQVYFYTKTKSKNAPYIAFNWSASDDKLIPNLVKSIADCSLADLKDDKYTIQNYTPNNNKSTIDKTMTSSSFISNNYKHLIEALSVAKPYDPDAKKPNGYILIGNCNGGTPNKYIIIGVGSPIKSYKHAFLNNAVMEETNPNLIAIIPYWDIFINNADCYMKGTRSHNFFDLQSFHNHNMEHIHKMLTDSELIDNVPPTYPKTGKSIFTDISNILRTEEHLSRSINDIISKASTYPDDEYYKKLIIDNGKIDLSDAECYSSFIELLGRWYMNNGDTKGKFRPIDVSYMPQ